MTTFLDRQLGVLLSTAEVVSVGDPSLVSVLEWMARELTVPNPELGRATPVCPFISRALESDSVWMAAVPDTRHPADVATAVICYLDIFESLPPVADEQLKAVVLVFADIADAIGAATMVDEIQHSLKPDIVDAGFMIGELHPWNDTPPRANPTTSFRPNRSPVPAIALRRLHPHDVGFLIGDLDERRARRLLLAYLRHIDWRRIPERAQKELASVLDGWLLSED